MPSIKLRDASVAFPIYNSRSRSLRSSLLARVGGTVQADDDGPVTVRALQNITLDLAPGDRLALVGHNGAGKSTLLRVFSGAYEPSTGAAEIKGRVSSLLDMTMGMDMELTGADNVVLRGVFLGMSIAEARSRIPEVEEFSELGGFMHLPMRTYSSGMRLRLAFAISTARVPDILLMDEFISVGDQTFARKARERLEHMIDNARIMVLASHSAQMIRQYCNRAILLQGGCVAREGAVDEILAAYQQGQQP
ncbi:ABC transporter ATP-binding protein [Chelatococcus daeguensis]|uniref:ABC transporter ATP-binding protein n=1 Tax=Chelatococcus daeguensis TaxID=444444 RepID=UPI0007AB7811|nr:ABC transporter ATP-binding protein [Chelatococcus daeguensis]KZE34425.1 sugar ABC transporter [Chelatococcus daeguensis]MBM3083269.1 ABC transporter ATP-binding protein [Chelatococcus daeguensis]